MTSSAEQYFLTLEHFTGPFDLLLFLIKNKKIPVWEINLIEITNQYLDFIEANLQTIEDVKKLSSYLLMATKLIEMKSKLLLVSEEPKVEANAQIIAQEELIKRLMRYNQILAVIPDLKARFHTAITCQPKEPSDLSFLRKNLADILFTNRLDPQALVDHLANIAERVEYFRPAENTITNVTISPEVMQSTLLLFIKKAQKPVTFAEIISKITSNRAELVTAFICLLELVKKQAIVFLPVSNQQITVVYQVTKEK